MKSILYIIPYFGEFRYDFELWLHTCKYNPTINWLILTDDKTEYNYPQNVEVVYTTFEKLKQRIQNKFDFPICLPTPYKLCDYRVAYGEIFQEELQNYDYWGHCDMDLVWGNIRNFITDDILNKYEKIGFQGHSTIYKNDKKINKRYKFSVNGKEIYRDIFSSPDNCFFDERAILDIYDCKNIPYYTKTIFANPSALKYNFQLRYFPKSERYKDKHQIFIWQNGSLYRVYCLGKKILYEEFMYIHFIRRKMNIQIRNVKDKDKFVIIPNFIKDMPENITYEYIKKHSKNNMILYYYNLFRDKKNKISFFNVINYFSHRIKQYIKFIFKNDLLK